VLSELSIDAFRDYVTDLIRDRFATYV
jgi:hypothetical protein